MAKQKTLNVNGHKIKIKTYRRSYSGNPVGFYVHISDSNNIKERIYVNTLSREEAETKAYVKFIKKHY